MAAGRVGAAERGGAGVRGLRDEALDAHDANAGVLGDDVVDQGGVAGAARVGVEVGEDRQWCQGDPDVLGEVGVGARRVAERVAAPRIEGRIDRGHLHVAEQRERRARAGPVGGRRDQAGLGSPREDVAEAGDLRGVVDDGDDAAAAAPEHALAPGWRPTGSRANWIEGGVIEANAAWGAGLNGCDPLAAAACIARATGDEAR